MQNVTIHHKHAGTQLREVVPLTFIVLMAILVGQVCAEVVARIREHVIRVPVELV